MDLKPVLKKINFKLVLFDPNFFSFYFISSHYYYSHFTPINSFSIDLVNLPLSPSTTIHCCCPPSSVVNYHQGHHRLPPTTSDCQLPTATSLASSTTIACLFASLATTVFHCLPHLPLFAIIACRQ